MFNDVIGQETPKKILINQIENSRISQAYLFHGRFGVGKRQTAISFAKAVNCEESSGCGKCISCRKIERYVHPDVQIIFPIPSTVKPNQLFELYQKGSECNFRLSFSQKASISIDAVRWISSKTFIKPYEGRLKVIIIIDADRMTPEASNAFLKTLEEPPSHAVFILITERPYYLPPTIVSRCQPIRFRTLSIQEIITALEERRVDPDIIEFASRLAAGSLGHALDLSKSEYLEIRQQLLKEFLDTPPKSWDRVFDFAQWLQDKCDKRMFAEVFISLYRDLLFIKEEKEELVLNFDCLSDLQKRADLCKLEEILESMDKLEDFVAAFEKNINLKVAFPPLLSGLA